MKTQEILLAVLLFIVLLAILCFAPQDSSPPATRDSEVDYKILQHLINTQQ